MSIIQYKSNDRLLLAIDCIIFGFDGKHLKGLFVKRRIEPQKDKWSLMGGFVNNHESVNEAAGRILNELTGLSDIYMEQLFCFGDADRDPGGRVVSIAYFALIKIDDYAESLMLTHNARWVELNKIPRLIFDHKQMVKLAQESLQQKVANHPIGFELLPDKFTLPQLQSLYEAIYETPLDKRNFTRKILSLGILNKLKEKETTSSKKGAFYYTFDKTKYKKLENEGVQFL
ncbi:MAG: NUDIX domain-containing protein [Chitinophagaceae bacterium]